MKKSFFAITGLALILATPFGAIAAEQNGNWDAENVYHGTGENGLTGLYYTASPYTVGTGLSINAHVVASSTGGATTTITPASITMGLGKNIEVSAASRLYASGGIAAVGDTDFYAKYKFRSQGEVMPAMALGLGITLPTSSNAAASDVTSVSGKIMIIGGGETNVADDTVVGLYFNITANFVDPGQVTQNNFISTNFGLMIPISDDHKLQGFIDTRTISNKTVATISGANGTVAMVGLRYAGRFLKITGGVETGGTNARLIAGVALEI